MPSAAERPLAGLAAAIVQQGLLGEAIEQGPALVFVADEQMRYVAVNETACRILGYEREEELLELPVTDVAVATDAPVLWEEMLRCRALESATVIRTRDGRLLCFSYRAAGVRVAGLPYYVSVGFVTDPPAG